jgi:hypothetical protein
MLSQLEQTADSGPELPTDDGCRLSGSYGWTRTTPAKRVSPISLKGNAVLNSYKAVMAHATQVGSSVVIRQDANNSLTLSNVDKSSLTASDFAFG